MPCGIAIVHFVPVYFSSDRHVKSITLHTVVYSRCSRVKPSTSFLSSSVKIHFNWNIVGIF